MTIDRMSETGGAAVGIDNWGIGKQAQSHPLYKLWVYTIKPDLPVGLLGESGPNCTSYHLPVPLPVFVGFQPKRLDNVLRYQSPLPCTVDLSGEKVREAVQTVDNDISGWDIGLCYIET